MKHGKFLKYLKLILESSEAEDDKEIENYKKTGKIPDGKDQQEFLNKHGDVLMDEETKRKYKEINKLLTKAGSKVLLSFTPKTTQELINYDIEENIQFHGQDKIDFINAITNIVINLDNSNRNFFLITLLAHSPDYIKIAGEIYDFTSHNHKDQPHFCEKLEILFHAKPEYEPTTFQAEKFDIEKEKTDQKFISGLKYFASDPLIKSNETIKTIVDSLLENLHIKIDFRHESNKLNSIMINSGEIFDLVDEYFNRIKKSFNRTKIERIIDNPTKMINDTDKKMLENFIGQIAIIDDTDSGADANFIETYFQISGTIPEVDRNKIIELINNCIQKIVKENADETDEKKIKMIKIDIKNIKDAITYIEKDNLDDAKRMIIKNSLARVEQEIKLDSKDKEMIDSYMRRIGIIYDHSNVKQNQTRGGRPGEISGWSRSGGYRYY